MRARLTSPRPHSRRRLGRISIIERKHSTIPDAAIYPNWANAFEPIHWLLMSMPPVVLVMISMILFGMGSIQTIVVTALLILPIMYTNTLEGIHAIDSSLIEMGHLYRARRGLMLREIYIPGIASHIVSGLTLSAGLGVRIVVLAEVLGAYSGIGHRFSLARTNLETEELYAWIIVCLLLVGVLEFLVFKPIRKRMTKWKSTAETERTVD
jgi:NitT/TauT family transport system permease protein